MLRRLGALWPRSGPVELLQRRGAPPLCRGVRIPAFPAWAAASVSAAGEGDWYEALAASAPVRAAEEVLLGTHAAVGLPWWGSILLSTVALRCAVTLPLAAYQHYILAKVENLQPEIKSFAKHLNQEVRVYANQFGWSKRVARLTYLKNMRRLVSELYVRDNCHPFKATVVVWVQLPMWIFISVALRNFSTGASCSEGFSVQEQLAVGGILWFPDLTAVDSTWILPVCVGVVNLLIVEIFALQKTGMSRFQMYITNCVRAVSVLMIPVAATVPSTRPENTALKENLVPKSVWIPMSLTLKHCFTCAVLAVLQPHGPVTEPAAAFSWISPAVPDPTDQIRLRYTL
ncbi:cytochrome c oxidase assembly protein COX18, mitochondrial isoform X2 [Nannospalax galili]|uniref:cytochrome c oxidase assembly protein COX18, mitochondrial isoform X2 n=1 Tax=Nannospalax galili TaxID=1026970 RepID=UPI000819B736|nr:cytochrome c oxidase assembly protein COX18, mitochondrial isoform X2 [Nannospalax galili]